MRDLSPLIDQVSAWEGVTAGPHRFGGVEFALGAVEIGHVHRGPGLVDIPFTRRLREALVAAGDAEPHHLLADSGWISFWVREDDDVERALRLFRLSYVQKRGRRDKAFAATQAAELDALGLDANVRAALTGHAAEADGEDA
jgi:hypothetical protein